MVNSESDFNENSMEIINSVGYQRINIKLNNNYNKKVNPNY